MTRVAINGFGRIGRSVFRVIAQRPESGIEIVAVNDLVPADNLAYLLKYDTLHGQFRVGDTHAVIEAGEDSFTVNGHVTRTFAVSPASTCGGWISQLKRE